MKFDREASLLSSGYLELPGADGGLGSLIDSGVDGLHDSDAHHVAFGRDRKEQLEISLDSCVSRLLRIGRGRLVENVDNFQLARMTGFIGRRWSNEISA